MKEAGGPQSSRDDTPSLVCVRLPTSQGLAREQKRELPASWAQAPSGAAGAGKEQARAASPRPGGARPRHGTWAFPYMPPSLGLSMRTCFPLADKEGIAGTFITPGSHPWEG